MSTQPADVLTDEATGRSVWVRWLWGGGKAYEVSHRDPEHACPVCCGKGNVVVADDVDVDCPAVGCSGGKVEAIFGWEESERGHVKEIVLWPNGEQDALDGWTT